MRGIITLCGSTRFKNEFNLANLALTLSGWVVLSVGAFLHSDAELQKIITEEVKHKLDILHKEKIALAAAIFVIDVDGYVGESTYSEIKYAQELQKKIYYWSDFEELIPFIIEDKEIPIKLSLKMLSVTEH